MLFFLKYSPNAFDLILVFTYVIYFPLKSLETVTGTYMLSFCLSACDEWKILPKPNLHRDVNRFGHTAVVSNG